MMKVELLTASQHVTFVWMPPFQKLPTVLIWGSRTFTLDDETQAQIYCNALKYQVTYSEAFAYHVPSGFDEIDSRLVPQEFKR